MIGFSCLTGKRIFKIKNQQNEPCLRDTITLVEKKGAGLRMTKEKKII